MGPVSHQRLAFLLTQAASSRTRIHPVARILAIAALAVANLLVCAYMERFFQDDAAGRALLVFLAVESLLLMVTIGTVFVSEFDEVLRHTAVLPVAQRERTWWVLVSCARHPASVAVWSGTVFTIAIVEERTAGALLASAGFAILLGIHWTALLGMVLARYAGRRSILPTLAAGLLIVLFGTSVLSVGSSSDPVLSAILPVQWAASGIRASTMGDIGGAALYVAFLAIPTMAFVAWGMRRA